MRSRILVIGVGVGVVAALCGAAALAAGPAYDTTFDDDGRQVTDIDNGFFGSSDAVHDLAIQDDDKIVLVGEAVTDPDGDSFDSSDAVVVRYEADGELDDTFDGDGKAVFGVADNYEEFNAVALDADDNIIAAGGVKIDNRFHYSVMRLDPEGDPDTEFGTDGVAAVDVNAGNTFSVSDVALDMAIQSDGKIVLVGSGDSNPAPTVSDGTLTVVRLEDDGDPDPTFGTGGIKNVVFPGDESISSGEAIAIDSTGKIVVAGVYSESFESDDEFGVARLETDGDPDPTFSGDGIQTSPAFGNVPTAVAVDDADRPVVLGNFKGNGESVLARYTTAGALDTSFSEDGFATMPFSWLARIGPFDAEDVVIEADGDLIVTGDSVDSMRAVRFASDGRITSSIDPVSAYPDDQANQGQGARAIGIDSGGNVVLAGRVFPEGENFSDFATVRLSSLGTPRPTTRIVRVAVNHRKRKSTVTFSGTASDPPLEFLCKLDGKPEAVCTSPKTYRRLKPGRHKIRVTAIDGAGDRDLTPATKRFRIRR